MHDETATNQQDLIDRIRRTRPWFSVDDIRVFVRGWFGQHADSAEIDRIASDEWDYFLKADEAREHLRQFVGRAALGDVIGDIRTLHPDVPNLDAIAAEEFGDDTAQAQARLAAVLRPPAPANQHAKTARGLVNAALHVKHATCQTVGQPMMREPGAEWEEVTRRCNGRERLFYAVEMGCIDEAGNAWKIRYRDDEFRLLVNACALLPLPVVEVFPGKVAAVRNWANEQTNGNYLYGEIAHAVGLVDRYVGGAQIGRINTEIIKVGLDVAQGEWAYGDVRIPTGGHGERLICPRQQGVK